jgi:hypothetical protein
MSVPFVDATQSEVCGRVAYQLVRMAYRQNRNKGWTPGRTISHAHLLAQGEAFWLIHLAIGSMYHYVVGRNMTAAHWRETVVQRARLEPSFRAVFFFDYKGQRGHSPRVTNRGAITFAHAPHGSKASAQQQSETEQNND